MCIDVPSEAVQGAIAVKYGLFWETKNNKTTSAKQMFE